MSRQISQKKITFELKLEKSKSFMGMWKKERVLRRGENGQIQRVESMASSGNHISFRWLEVEDPNYWEGLGPKEFRLGSWQKTSSRPLRVL